MYLGSKKKALGDRGDFRQGQEGQRRSPCILSGIVLSRAEQGLASHQATLRGLQLKPVLGQDKKGTPLSGSCSPSVGSFVCIALGVLSRDSGGQEAQLCRCLYKVSRLVQSPVRPPRKKLRHHGTPCPVSRRAF